MACDDRHSDWKDFPNGLQVLLVDEDVKTLNEYKCKLEECKYIVTPFTDGTEALKCANTSGCTFHVALVEAMIGEGLEGLRLLKEMSKYLPVVLMSNTHNMALMMQGIAMGAADFLQKPLSDEKLRNIWTHVVRKAVNTGDLALMETLAPSKAKTSTVFQVSTPRDVHTKKNIFKEEGGSLEVCGKRGHCGENGDADEPAAKVSRVQSSTLGMIRAPFGDATLQSEPEHKSIEEAASRSDSPEQASEDLAASVLLPKMEWGNEMLCQPASIHVMSDESLGDMDGDYLRDLDESKEPQQDEPGKKPKLKMESTDDQGYDSVVLDDLEDTGAELDPCSLLSVPNDVLDFPMEGLDGGEVHDHEFNTDTEVAILAMIKGDEEERSGSAGTTLVMGTDEEASDEHGLYADEQGGKGGKSGRRKMKVDWTPELHRRFVQAVEQLGVEKAIPSRILELMGVQCLTRHNIASHLQKYRSHRRHVMAREAAEAATWQQQRRTPEGNGWARMRRDGTPWVSNHTNPPPIQPRPAIGTPSSVQPHASFAGPPPQPGPPHQPMMLLHVWGHPSMEPAPPMWQQPVGVPMQPMWPAPDGGLWGQPRLGMPVGPLPPMSPFYLPTTPSMPFVPAMHPPAPGTCSMDEAMPLPFYHQLLDDPELAGTCGKPFEPHPPMDVLEATINEALSNPKTAQLPLGLKAPSVEGVMAELYKTSLAKV